MPQTNWTKWVFVGTTLLFLPAAKNSCGSQEANTTLNSPVQAVTTILERADGNVEAEMVLISTSKSPHAFVDTAKEARVRTPSGAYVTLAKGSPGHYAASRASNQLLNYE